MNGEKALASGNVAHWSIKAGVGGIGAIEISLDHDTTPEDEEEVEALMQELKPPGARMVERGTSRASGKQAVTARVNSFLHGGSSN
jgi:hypothetical protein